MVKEVNGGVTKKGRIKHKHARDSLKYNQSGTIGKEVHREEGKVVRS